MAKKFDPAVVEAEENLLIDFQFLLQEAMNEKSITLGELAKRVGLSKSRISQMMGAEANPTVKSMAHLFHALHESLCLSRGKADLPSAHAETWHWSEPKSGRQRIDDRLVAVVKETSASNDNYTDRFLLIDSELDVAA